MSPEFLAKKPRAVKPASMPNHLWLTLRRIGWILWQVLVPFHSGPEPIDALPDATIKVTDAHVQQCQWIFDQAEARRVYLEQKAQSTFGLMLFLVPLLTSLFVFIISKAIALSTTIHLLLITAAVLLVLGFIAAVRAVAVKANETLFLDSVIDKDGQFKEYSESDHARGLLYCASMNTAMNDHIAQFVKGAHILTAVAVFLFIIAAALTSFAFSRLPSPPPTATTIVGPVDISGPALTALRDQITNLKTHIEELDTKLTEMQRAPAANTVKRPKTPSDQKP